MSDYTEDDLAQARILLQDPSIERIAQALAGCRRAGERWVEISAAHWARQAGASAFQVADALEDRSWRRPEYQSQLDLEAEAAKAELIIRAQEDK